MGGPSEPRVEMSRDEARGVEASRFEATRDELTRGRIFKLAPVSHSGRILLNRGRRLKDPVSRLRR